MLKYKLPWKALNASSISSRASFLSSPRFFLYSVMRFLYSVGMYVEWCLSRTAGQGITVHLHSKQSIYK